MAIKLEVTGGTLYIKDASNSDEIIERLPISQNTWVDTTNFPILITSSYLNYRQRSYDLADLVDSTDTPFNIETLNAFIDENFKTASGGSGASQIRVFANITARDDFFVNNTNQLFEDMPIFVGDFDIGNLWKDTKLFNWGGKDNPNTYMPSEWDEIGTVATVENLPVPPTPPDLTGYVKFNPTPFNAALGEFPTGTTKGTVYNIIAPGTVDNVAFTTSDILMQIDDFANPVIYSGYWIKIPASSVQSWGDLEGVITDTQIIALLQSLGFNMGSATDQLPVITSPLVINLTTGDSLHYELEADYGVSYSWDFSNVSGITTINGSNDREIIGGSSMSPGVYIIEARAINYNGEDIENITLNISNPPFNNTKSVRFNNNQYLSGFATSLNPLYRVSNGSGASDAWTICFWFKAGTSSNNEQTILMFGGDDQNNDGRIQIWHDGSNGDNHLRLRYGTNNNYLEFETPNNSVLPGVWNHFIITYDGGTTGSSSGDINDYYSRFKIFLNGVNQVLNTSNDNYGWSGEITPDYFRIGRNGSSNDYMRNNCHVDEVALWSSDQQNNVSDIYNGGVTHDLQIIANPPSHYWRMGDGDTYPTLNDAIGMLSFFMLGMSAADITNDVP